MKWSFFIIFLLELLLSCSDNNSQTIDYKQVNKEYQSYKSFFDKNLVNHFPKNIDTNIIEDLESLYETSNYQSLIIVMKSTKKKINIKKEKFKFLSKYKATDTCLFVVKSLEDLNHRDTNLVNKISKTCNCKNKYPLPNAEGLYYKNEKINCKLQDDFTYYVIEAKPGKYLDDKYLKESKYMPKEWEHGFTRGFAISEEKEVIIYWIVIW